MRKILMLGAVLAAVVVPTASQAQFTLGARVGYGLALGDVGGTLAMSDWVKSQIPVQLDALYRVNPNIAVGAYFSYGFAQTGGPIADACDLAGADCSASIMRLGLEGTYSLAAMGPVAPWLGVGFGYEWNKLDDGTDSITFKGFEFVNLQVGGDFKVSPQISVGPYVMFSLGQYDSADVAGTSADITDKAMHEWLSFGVRGKFDL